MSYVELAGSKQAQPAPSDSFCSEVIADACAMANDKENPQEILAQARCSVSKPSAGAAT